MSIPSFVRLIVCLPANMCLCLSISLPAFLPSYLDSLDAYLRGCVAANILCACMRMCLPAQPQVCIVCTDTKERRSQLKKRNVY